MSRNAESASPRDDSSDADPEQRQGTTSARLPLLVTIEDAADILSISRTSVYQLVWNDELTPVRIGRCLRFSVEQLERFVAQRLAHSAR